VNRPPAGEIGDRRALTGPPPAGRAATVRRAAKIRRDATARACDTRRMLFDGPPAELPIATLMPTSLPAQGRLLLGNLDRWFARRWAWIAPRALPLVFAVIGLFAILTAVKYAGQWARADRMSLGVHTRSSSAPPHLHSMEIRGHRQPTEILVRPLGIHDRYVVLTIDPPDAP
jgi:hypothetical protein